MELPLSSDFRAVDGAVRESTTGLSPTRISYAICGLGRGLVRPQFLMPDSVPSSLGRRVGALRTNPSSTRILAGRMDASARSFLGASAVRGRRAGTWAAVADTALADRCVFHSLHR